MQEVLRDLREEGPNGLLLSSAALSEATRLLQMQALGMTTERRLMGLQTMLVAVAEGAGEHEEELGHEMGEGSGNGEEEMQPRDGGGGVDEDVEDQDPLELPGGGPGDRQHR